MNFMNLNNKVKTHHSCTLKIYIFSQVCVCISLCGLAHQHHLFKWPDSIVWNNAWWHPLIPFKAAWTAAIALSGAPSILHSVFPAVGSFHMNGMQNWLKTMDGVYAQYIYRDLFFLQTWIRLPHQWGKRILFIIFSLSTLLSSIQRAVQWWSAVSGLKANHQFEYLVDGSAFSGRKEIKKKKKKMELRVRHSSSLLVLQINAWICVCVCVCKTHSVGLCSVFDCCIYISTPLHVRGRQGCRKKSDGESEAGNHQDPPQKIINK